MAYHGLADFIKRLDKEGELHIINEYVDPVFEITEVADRITKHGGKALLFRNTGCGLPLLINAYGSDKRMSLAMGRKSYDDAGKEIEALFNSMLDKRQSFFDKLKLLPSLVKMSSYMPSFSGRKGKCQEVINRNPDLGSLPILKCWPHDGGRFITLPMVNTVHPVTGRTNVGMYRMQVIDKNTTAMHWQLHKTGANHYEAWKRENRKMPVSVALGGDPVYTFAATAPLPENISEHILAGFLRGKSVKLVKCVTNDLYVPEDADIIIEGFVDPAEELFVEGPFGDHTGFYSLTDLYPRFHVTCITHRKEAVYPATIVGIPPQEDVWLAKATEKIFLAPVKMALQPEVVDFHLPDAGVAHNLLIVKINKTYAGQGMKALASLLGAGQMAFTKYMIAVSGDVDIRDYRQLATHVFSNVSFASDILFLKGPLDALDHAPDAFAFGGKMGIDATTKTDGELLTSTNILLDYSQVFSSIDKLVDDGIVVSAGVEALKSGIPFVVFSVDFSCNSDIEKLSARLAAIASLRLVVLVDKAHNPDDVYTVAWHALGNSDPLRDHKFIGADMLLIDGTTKAFGREKFPRRWPNAVCAADDTIKTIDSKWNSLGLGSFLPSPSLKFKQLTHPGKDEVLV